MATNISLQFIVVALAAVSTSLACRDKPRDCEELKQAGFTNTGTYIIFPDKQSGGLRVRCDMTTAGGGWTVIQRRISNTSFYHDWNIYERGFGNPGDSYWLGNLPISKLTEQDGYQLRVDMRHSNGSHAFALYNFFKMYDVRSNYQILVNGYSGTAGDSMTYHNGRPFSTSDKDHDIWANNCATSYTGAWWYGACHQSNLNGLWGSTTYGKGINWLTFTGYYQSLDFVEMKVRVYKPF